LVPGVKCMNLLSINVTMTFRFFGFIKSENGVHYWKTICVISGWKFFHKFRINRCPMYWICKLDTLTPLLSRWTSVATDWTMTLESEMSMLSPKLMSVEKGAPPYQNWKYRSNHRNL
jgi:hypothetical protein